MSGLPLNATDYAHKLELRDQTAMKRCRCGGTFAVADSKLGPIVIHSMPPCAPYVELDAMRYLHRNCP